MPAQGESIGEEVKQDINTGSPESGRPFLSVKEAVDYFNISRTKLYELIANGELRTVKIGRRTLIPAQAIADYSRSLDLAAGEG